MDSTDAVRDMTRDAKPELQSIVDVLSHYRRWLVGTYILLLTGWFLIFLYTDYWIFPEIFNGHSASQTWTVGWDGIGWRILAVGVFIVIQVVFTMGTGRVRISGQRTKFRKIWMSATVFSVLMTLLALGILLTFADMTERLGSSTRGTGQLSIAPSRFIAALIAAWLVWMVFAWLSARNLDRETVISKLTTIILAGSWIEFSVALPIELAKRERNQDCPCASGSWWALVICLPILLWSIGPALFLLYRRERHLCETDSRHAFRILLQKSRNSKASSRQS